MKGSTVVVCLIGSPSRGSICSESDMIDELVKKAAFFDELEKLGGSTLRSRTTLERAGDKLYRLVIKGSSGERVTVGGAQMASPGKILRTVIAPKFRGIGLGKKMYGELARRAPNQQLQSDAIVSDAARRVWGSMRRRPKSYRVKEEGPRGIDEVLRAHAAELQNPGSPPRRAVFTAQLPLKAAKR